MIPLKLELRSFLSYGPQWTELDFGALDTLVCLSGDNGSGKSSLLDAITFSLWGESRVGSGEAVIHADEEEAEVRFEFELDGSRYRVIRKYRRPTRPKAAGQHSLALYSWDGENWSTRADGAVRDTQAQIVRLLKMTYQLFVNSSYMAQGRSAEFSRAEPARRKDVLGEILGLDVYDQVAEQVRADARDAEITAVSWEQKAQTIADTMGDVAALEADRDRVAEELRAAQAQAQLAESELALAQAEQAQQAQAQAALERQQEAVRRAEEELASVERRLAATRLTPAQQSVLARREDIRRAQAEQARLRAEEATLADLASQHAKAGEAVSAAQANLAAAEAARAQAAQSLRAQRHQLAAKANQLGVLEQEVARLAGELATHQAAEQSLAERRAALEKWRERAKLLAQEQERLTLEGQTLRVEHDHLLESDGCPVCGTPMAKEHHDELVAQLEAKLAASRSEYSKRKGELAEALQEETKLGGIIKRLESQVAAGQHIVGDLARARAAAATASQARTEVERLDREIAAAKDGPPTPEIVAAQAALREAREAQAALGYDAEAHRTLRARLAALTPTERQAQELAAAEQAEASVADARRELAAEKERRAAQVVVEKRRLDQAEADVVARGNPAAKVAAAQRALATAREQERRLVGGLEALKSRLREARQLEHLLVEARAQSQSARARSQLCGELAQHMGRRGVQAMIIEGILPELEHTTNNLLDRITSGRQRVRFQTQRQARSGKVVETLDLEVLDEHGLRSYDALSGGEAFRIDFAVRLGLAQLLANRAGAKLQMLVIDEGFGSQDAANLQRLVEALQSIREGFRKIVVVSHIGDLKGHFPSRVEVSKGERGSSLRVIAAA